MRNGKIHTKMETLPNGPSKVWGLITVMNSAT